MFLLLNCFLIIHQYFIFILVHLPSIFSLKFNWLSRSNHFWSINYVFIRCIGCIYIYIIIIRCSTFIALLILINLVNIRFILLSYLEFYWWGWIRFKRWLWFSRIQADKTVGIMLSTLLWQQNLGSFEAFWPKWIY